MIIEPLNKNILLELDQEAEQIEGGFMIAQSEGKKTEARAVKGNVVAVAKDAADTHYTINSPSGKETVNHTLPITSGDKVLASKWDGQYTSVEGKQYLLIKYEYILAKLT